MWWEHTLQDIQHKVEDVKEDASGASEPEASLMSTNDCKVLTWRASNDNERGSWCQRHCLAKDHSIVADKVINILDVAVVGFTFRKPFCISIPVVLCCNKAPHIRIIFSSNENDGRVAYCLNDSIMHRRHMPSLARSTSGQFVPARSSTLQWGSAAWSSSRSRRCHLASVFVVWCHRTQASATSWLSPLLRSSLSCSPS